MCPLFPLAASRRHSDRTPLPWPLIGGAGLIIHKTNNKAGASCRGRQPCRNQRAAMSSTKVKVRTSSQAHFGGCPCAESNGDVPGLPTAVYVRREHPWSRPRRRCLPVSPGLRKKWPCFFTPPNDFFRIVLRVGASAKSRECPRGTGNYIRCVFPCSDKDLAGHTLRESSCL